MTTATPNRDRIVRVRFSGLRTAADVQLDCGPMTVLIGDRNVREDAIVQSTDRVERGGANLANAFHTLINRADWQN